MLFFTPFSSPLNLESLKSIRKKFLFGHFLIKIEESCFVLSDRKEFKGGKNILGDNGLLGH